MVLERSFIVLNRVGERTERRIWDQGIKDWDDFLEEPSVHPFSRDRKAESDMVLERAKAALGDGDAHFFAPRLRSGHQWRLYPSFRDEAVFLDIETTGLSRSSAVTVVGLSRGEEFRALVRGKDLTRRTLAEALEGARLIVTFNGATFDLPILRHHFRVEALDIPHVDLRYAAAKVGLRGGLKRIERELGVGRDREFAMMTGEDAVRLWHLWERRGNEKAFELLLKYNRADVLNLRKVADMVCGMAERLAFPD